MEEDVEMKGLDPIVHGSKVLPLVYAEQTNKRLVRRLRLGRSYGRCTTIDVIGCNMLCSYCYVDSSFLLGRGEMLSRESRGGKVRAYTPDDLVQEYALKKKENNWPSRVQITAAEPFLTPDWLLEVIQLLQPIMEKERELLWIDTNGINLVQNPELVKRLIPFSHFLRLFVSSKHAPEKYTAMTRVNAQYADSAFQCVQLLWRNGISSFLQGPIADLFSPDTFQWYLERLLKMHPAAPILMDLDRLSYLPLTRIRKGLKSTGLWNQRHRGTVIEKEWQKFLENHFGRKMKRLISVDYFPEDEQLVRSLVFENQPIESCALFAGAAQYRLLLLSKNLKEQTILILPISIVK